MISRSRSGPTISAIFIEWITSAKRMVTCLYSVVVISSASGAPHEWQNRAFSSASVPQLRHAAAAVTPPTISCRADQGVWKRRWTPKSTSHAFVNPVATPPPESPTSSATHPGPCRAVSQKRSSSSADRRWCRGRAVASASLPLRHPQTTRKRTQVRRAAQLTTDFAPSVITIFFVLATGWPVGRHP